MNEKSDFIPLELEGSEAFRAGLGRLQNPYLGSLPEQTPSARLALWRKALAWWRGWDAGAGKTTGRGGSV